MATTAEKSSERPAGTHPSVAAVLRGMQFKWTLLVTIGMFALAIGSDLLVSESVKRLVTEQQINGARKQCATLAAAVVYPLNRNDAHELLQTARRFEGNPSILYIEFYTTAGALLDAYSTGAVKPAGLSPSSDTKSILRRVEAPDIVAGHVPYLDVAAPATLRGIGGSGRPDDLAGYVRMGFNLAQIQSDLAAFLSKMRLVAVFTIIAMVPMVFMIVRRVTAPLNELSSVVTQLAAGDYKVRAHIRRSDEIGKLAAAFNGMADELSASHDNLVRLNVELEDRVLQRTRQLKELAARDPLTGLYNRRHLNEVFNRRFAEAERYGNDLSCIMIDLDNFKQVNDQHGHEVGDSLLMLTAAVIGGELRGADVGARFGGDEFCVLLPQTSADQAQEVARRILERFKSEVRTRMSAAGARVAMSAGIAGMQELQVVHPDELFKAADQALYEAKEAGKNCVRTAAALA